MSGNKKPIKLTLFYDKKLPVNPQYTFLLPYVSLYVLSFSTRASTVYAVPLTVMFQGFLFLSVAKARSLIIKCHLIAQQQRFYSQRIYLRSNACNYKHVKLCQQNIFKITLNTTYSNKNKNKINCTV